MPPSVLVVDDDPAFLGLVARYLARVPPDKVERPVTDQADQKRLGAAASRIEAVRLLPELHEGVVHRVGCERRLADDAKRDPMQAGAPPVVNQTERCLIAS